MKNQYIMYDIDDKLTEIEMEYIIELKLSINNVTKIPYIQNINKYINLRKIDFNRINITSFEHFSQLLNLYEIDCTDNQITSFEHQNIYLIYNFLDVILIKLLHLNIRTFT